MSFYNEDSAFAESPFEVIFALILKIGITITIIILSTFLSSPYSKGGSSIAGEHRCAKNEVWLTNIIHDYNSTVKSNEKITEINDKTIKLLIKNGLPKDFAPPLTECKYHLTDEKNDWGANKVICEYHENQKKKIQKSRKEKKERDEKIIRFIQIFVLIYGLLQALAYFLLSLLYKAKKRDIYYYTGSIVVFLLLIFISYVLSPVRESQGYNHKGEKYIEYKHLHPLSDLLPFLVRREYIKIY